MAAHMDMVSLHSAMQELLACNECEAAARMDLKDAEANLAFHQRKVEAMAGRLRDMAARADRAQRAVAHIVSTETAAPLALSVQVGE